MNEPLNRATAAIKKCEEFFQWLNEIALSEGEVPVYKYQAEELALASAFLRTSNDLDPEKGAHLQGMLECCANEFECRGFHFLAEETSATSKQLSENLNQIETVS